MFICYEIAFLVFWVTSKFLYFKRVIGLKNVPKRGALVVCCNHKSNFDIPLLTCSIPRILHYMAKEEMFETKFGNLFYRSLNAFPIRRGKADVNAIKKAISYVRQNRVVAIFPEGTRNSEPGVGAGKTGAALIAIRGRAKILPVGISGSYKKFSRIEVRIGKPIDVSEHYNVKITQSLLERVTDDVMKEIFNLCSLNYAEN